MAGRVGKYAHVTGTLRRLDGVEPERRAVVEQVQAEVLAPVAENELPLSQEQRVADGLRLLLSADRTVRDALRMAKRLAAGSLNAAVLARGYAGARELLDQVNEWRASAQLLVDAYEGLMLRQMELDGLSSLRMTDGGSVSTYLEPYAQVVDAEALRLWVMADQDLARRVTLPWGTLNALNKERLLAGEAPPPGVETYAKAVVRLNKA